MCVVDALVLAAACKPLLAAGILQCCSYQTCTASAESDCDWEAALDAVYCELRCC
jgi:hypothetical protein